MTIPLLTCSDFFQLRVALIADAVSLGLLLTYKSGKRNVLPTIFTPMYTQIPPNERNCMHIYQNVSDFEYACI